MEGLGILPAILIINYFIKYSGDKMTINNKKFIEERWFKKQGDEWSLMATRCIDCNKVFFPPKTVCPRCFDGKLEEVPLSSKGTLYTYALSVMGPTDLTKPFIMGFIDLPEQIKLYTLITGCQYEDLKVDMPMEMVIEEIKKDSDGSSIAGYKFRPVKKEGEQS